MRHYVIYFKEEKVFDGSAKNLEEALMKAEISITDYGEYNLEKWKPESETKEFKEKRKKAEQILVLERMKNIPNDAKLINV